MKKRLIIAANYTEVMGLYAVQALMIYKQQFLQSDWLRTCQLIPNQRPVQFHQCKKMKLSAKR